MSARQNRTSRGKAAAAAAPVADATSAVASNASTVPDFPVPLGCLRVAQSCLRIVNAAEAEAAAAAAADEDHGLVAVFDSNGGGGVSARHILCYRTETYDKLLDLPIEEHVALAAVRISAPSGIGAAAHDNHSPILTATDLSNLAVVTNFREHLTKYPSHRWWSGVADLEDESTPCDSHSSECKCNLPAELACLGPPFCALDHEHRKHVRCCGPSCRTLRLASCEVRLAAHNRQDEHDADGEGAPAPVPSHSSRYMATVHAYLEAASFDLDRRLDAGPARAELSADHPAAAYSHAMAGDRPVSTRASRKELLALVRRMAAVEAAAVEAAAVEAAAVEAAVEAGAERRAERRAERHAERRAEGAAGADDQPGGLVCLSSADTLNGYRGIGLDSVCGACQADGDVAGNEGGGVAAAAAAAAAAEERAGGDEAVATASFAVPALLESISKRGAQNEAAVAEPAGRAALDAIAPRLRSTLHPYQRRGVAWMVAHEAEATAGEETLHPAWMHLRAPDSQEFYLHTYTGELSTRRFPAPASDTCGGEY